MRAPAPEPAGPFDPGWGPPRLDLPLSWSFPLCRFLGLEIRLHLFFLAVILIELSRAALAGREAGADIPLGVAWTAVGLALLFGSVLLHELARCLVTRRLGGSAGLILAWPLGGLADPVPPEDSGGALRSALAGLVANVALALVLGGLLWFETADSVVALPGLFDGEAILDGLFATAGSWWLTLLFIAQWMNGLVLVANLLPILPFDGGRILEALIRRFRPRTTAMRITERVGGIGAIALGVASILLAEGVWSAYLIAVAFFCGYVCFGAGRRRAFTEAFLESFDGDWSPVEDDPEVVGRIGSGEGATKRQGPSDEEVDALLDKIRTSGAGSLSWRERRVLRRATRHRRGH